MALELPLSRLAVLDAVAPSGSCASAKPSLLQDRVLYLRSMQASDLDASYKLLHIEGALLFQDVRRYRALA